MSAVGSASAPALLWRPGPARRQAGWVVAVLAVAALLGPLLHCGLLTSSSIHTHADTHGHADMTVVEALSSHAHASDSADMWCAPHTTQCVPQMVLSARIGDPLTLTWSAALAATAVLAMSLLSAGGRWTRGPPVLVTVAAGGREILTRFCIARR
ncbi:hypothetical protein ACL02S_00245 [Nocardia sp. 004]|uniref:hypothetical protein n=1 Tax=Nocardia sp. 004 TaxID=3385978 RepID=UPI0039A0954F